MEEKEVKVLNINKEEIEKKLIEAGAVLIKDENQINIRFDTENNFLKKSYNGYLRVRTTNNLLDNTVSNTLTLKRNVNNDKFRLNEELETEISNCEETIKILELLGYKAKSPGYKHRKSYKFNNIIFEIDTWDKDTYPKPYLEIELTCEEDLEKAIELLNLDRTQITTKSIGELKKD